MSTKHSMKVSLFTHTLTTAGRMNENGTGFTEGFRSTIHRQQMATNSRTAFQELSTTLVGLRALATATQQNDPGGRTSCF